MDRRDVMEPLTIGCDVNGWLARPLDHSRWALRVCSLWGVWIVSAGVAVVSGGCTRSAVIPPTLSIAPRGPVDLIPRLEPEPEPAGVDAPALSHTPWSAEVPFKPWKYIVLHHTASEQGSVESIHAAHVQRKDRQGQPWLGIGYHFVIGNGRGMADGEIAPTFRWKQQLAGAHAGVNEYNQQGIGIVLVGNFEQQPPTPAQCQAVKRLVSTLCRRFEISADRVVGHAAVKATACPGRKFPLSEVRASLVAYEDHRGHPLPPSTRIRLTSGTSRKDRQGP